MIENSNFLKQKNEPFEYEMKNLENNNASSNFFSNSQNINLMDNRYYGTQSRFMHNILEVSELPVPVLLWAIRCFEMTQIIRTNFFIDNITSEIIIINLNQNLLL